MKIGTSGKRFLCGVIASVILTGLTGCGGSSDGGTTEVPPSAGPVTSAPEAPEEPTVTIKGKEYTCGQLVEAEGCGDATQQAFEKYGQNIDAFVNSGQLGPFNSDEFSYGDVAFAGLVACVFNTQDEFIGYMLTLPEFAKMERVEFVPAWYAAGRFVCPANQNPGSSRIP